MITAYLSFGGNAAEAAAFYAKAFQAGEPEFMRYSQMPPGADPAVPSGMRDKVMHGSVRTFAGEIMLADSMPDDDLRPTSAVTLLVVDTDHDRMRRVFRALSEGGEALVPLEPAFFSPLYGMVKDKYGFSWQFIDGSDMESGPA